MKLFLVAGKARSGKDVTAKYIVEYYNQLEEKTVITRFSKYIKLLAMEMTDWNGNEDNKPRKFLQKMGAYIRETLDNPYFFIRRMQEDIEIYERFFDNVVISDVRLPDEIEQMKKHSKNTYSIKVVNRKENDLSKSEKNHPTETLLDDYEDFDYIIYNDNDESLKEKVFEILGSVE